MTEPTAANALETFSTEGIERILCVVAHPDDLEYGSSAAVAEWVAAGIEVSYLLLTSGEAGMQIPPSEVGPLRAGEQRAACDVVGVSDLTILNHPDGMLTYSLDIRRDIARRIRQVRPQVVVTMNWDVETPWGLNQADHRVAGLCALDGCRDADNTWVFPELADDEGLAKWGPTWLLVGGDPNPTHAVPVGAESVDKAVRSLQAHEAYLAALPGHPAPQEFIPGMLSMVGPMIGVDHAVSFRAHKLRMDG